MLFIFKIKKGSRRQKEILRKKDSEEITVFGSCWRFSAKDNNKSRFS